MLMNKASARNVVFLPFMLLLLGGSRIAIAQMCTADTGVSPLYSMSSGVSKFSKTFESAFKDMFDLSHFAGVTLNKTLDILNSVDEIRGAAYDPEKGEIVFIGQGEIPLNERIDIDDLVVAVRSVFGMNQDPGITFHSTPQTMQHGFLDVTYFGATKGTEFGQILFDADYLLKQLTLGITPSGQQLTSVHPSLVSMGYESFADKMIDAELFLGSYAVEFWFAPQTIVVEPYVSSVDASKSFVFSEMSMKVYTKIVNVTDGSEATGNPQVSNIKSLADAFAANITANYDSYANLSGFEVLQKLKRLGRITSVVRWMRYNDISVDLSFLANYVPQNVATPQQINMLQVCRDHSQDGAWLAGVCSIVGKINGGIIYDLDYEEFDGYDQPTAQQSDEIAQALASAGRVLNPQSASDMKWTFTAPIGGTPTNLIGIAQTVAESEKEGRYDFTAVDLSLPNQSGEALAFTRYYDSFSSLSSRFGPGWSEVPFTLRFLEAPSEFEWCEDPQCAVVLATLDMRRDLILVDRQRGISRHFQAVGVLGWTGGGSTVYKPYYLSERSGDFIQERPDGWFVYNRVNQTNQVVQQVWFLDKSLPAAPRFTADPYHVGVPGGGLSGGAEEGIWVDYHYDADDRLISIAGQDGVRLIQIDYAGDRISRVWYPSASGVRDVVYTYAAGRLATATRSSGHVMQYTYSSNDPFDGTISTVLDQSRAEILGSVGADLESRANTAMAEGNPELAVSVFYDRPNGLVQTTDTLGRVSALQRDARNRLLSRSLQASSGQGTQTLGESYAYADPNPLAGPTSITDARGNVTTLTWDAAGNVTSIKDSQNRTTTIERGVDTADGQPVVVVTDAKGRKSAQKTDEFSRVIASYRRIQVSSKTPILENGVSTGFFDFTFSYAPGHVTTYEYDENSGAVEAVIRDSAGLAGQYPWISGNETAQVNARDGFGQATLVTSPGGYATQYGYDGLARMTAVKGPSDVAPVTISYHAAGLAQDRVSGVTSAAGTSGHAYDVANRVRRVTDSRGITTSYFHNMKNQVERVTETAGGDTLTTQYFYDAFGRLQYKQLPNGARVNYGYDGFDRMVSMVERESTDANTGNAAPVLTSVPPSVSTVSGGGTFTFDVNATDAENDLRHYSLIDAPQGMTIDPLTGVINWTPVASQAGSHRVVVQVSDGQGGVDTVAFDVIADDALSPSADNCTDVPNPDQRDTDGDGYGNVCDADLDNDGIVNFSDMAILKGVYGTAHPHADFNGDGIVDALDLELMRSMFGNPPGPSGVAQ